MAEQQLPHVVMALAAWQSAVVAAPRGGDECARALLACAQAARAAGATQMLAWLQARPDAVELALLEAVGAPGDGQTDEAARVAPALDALVAAATSARVLTPPSLPLHHYYAALGRARAAALQRGHHRVFALVNAAPALSGGHKRKYIVSSEDEEEDDDDNNPQLGRAVQRAPQPPSAALETATATAPPSMFAQGLIAQVRRHFAAVAVDAHGRPAQGMGMACGAVRATVVPWCRGFGLPVDGYTVDALMAAALNVQPVRRANGYCYAVRELLH